MILYNVNALISGFFMSFLNPWAVWLGNISVADEVTGGWVGGWVTLWIAKWSRAIKEVDDLPWSAILACWVLNSWPTPDLFTSADDIRCHAVSDQESPAFIFPCSCGSLHACITGNRVSSNVDAQETTRYSQTFDLSAALREQAAHPMWGILLWKVLEMRLGRRVSDNEGIDRLDWSRLE